ncbi:MAG: hypothetical protein JHC61_09160 [Burkholderiaceae bacterium]|nr:hypothetical protein [Burkholderiaceae bacterium]
MKRIACTVLGLASMFSTSPGMAEKNLMFDCDHAPVLGFHTGRFVQLIDKDGWESTNYIFEGSDVRDMCLRVLGNSTRRILVHEAFKEKLLVKVWVDTGNVIAGIAF